MKHLKATPGQWTSAGTRVLVVAPHGKAGTERISGVSYDCLARTMGNGAHDNAALIAEAGTVYHETGLTPRQMADQRDALRDALDLISGNAYDAGIYGEEEANMRLSDIYRIARAAIARATDTTTKGE